VVARKRGEKLSFRNNRRNIINHNSPGTSSVEHLRQNLEAATLHLPPETIAALDSIAWPKK